MLGALVRRIDAAQPDERNAAVLADALAEATRASYAAVGEPVEGTILTVCRAASEAATALLRERARGPVQPGASSTAAAAAREAWSARPTSCRRCATPGWSTPVAAGCA